MRTVMSELDSRPRPVRARTLRQALLVVAAAVLASTIVGVNLPAHAAQATTTTSHPSTSTRAATTTTVPDRLVARRDGKYNVLVIGDSLGTDLGGGLAWQLQSSTRINLIQKGKSITGLANAWYYNWPQHLNLFLTQYHPQLLVVLLGGNDEQGMNVNGSAAPFNSPAWVRQYSKDVATMMNEAVAHHCAVLWVGMPIMYPNGYRQGMQVINSIFAKVAKPKKHVTFLSTWKFFADAHGQFRFNAKVNGKLQAIRTADGIHPTSVGQNVLATYIINEMQTQYGLPAGARYPMRFTK